MQDFRLLGEVPLAGRTGLTPMLLVRAAAGILANDDTSGVGVTIALTQNVVIPAQETTNLVGVVSGQRDSSFATEAISPKILSHYSFSSSKE